MLGSGSRRRVPGAWEPDAGVRPASTPLRFPPGIPTGTPGSSRFQAAPPPSARSPALPGSGGLWPQLFSARVFLARWASCITAMADLFDFGDDDVAAPALVGGVTSSHVVGTGAQPTQSTTGAPPTPPVTGAQPTPDYKAKKRARPGTPCKGRVVKNKTHVSARLSCTEITGPAALQCIFIPAPSQQEGKQKPKQPARFPVPLWPTYVLAGAPTHKADEHWLLLGYAENWIARIAALSLKSSKADGRRNLVNGLRNLWVPRFQAALKVARKTHSGDDGEQDDSSVQDDDTCDRVTGPRNFTCAKHVCYEVDVEGHTMTVFNSLRPIVMQLDDRTIAFLSTHFAPSVATLAHSQLKLPTVAPKPAAPFHFTPDQLRNIRGKIVWVPTGHLWKLEVKKPKKILDDSELCFPVAPSLSPADYMTAKVDAYVQAIRFWNDMDGSTRLRISVPTVGGEEYWTEPSSGSSVQAEETEPSSGSSVRAEESGQEVVDVVDSEDGDESDGS